MYDTGLFEFLYFAGMFLVAACQWLGIVKLAGTERKSIWLMMVVGSTLFTVSTLGLAWYVYSDRYGPGMDLDRLVDWMQATEVGLLLGYLIFVSGFMLHCVTLSKSSGRVRELENIIAAQAQENALLREGSR